MRQMLLEFDSVLGKTRTLLAYEDETTDLFSLIFFGERGHHFYDISAFLDYYFFDHFSALDTLGGSVEGRVENSIKFKSFKSTKIRRKMEISGKTIC